MAKRKKVVIIPHDQIMIGPVERALIEAGDQPLSDRKKKEK